MKKTLLFLLFAAFVSRSVIAQQLVLKKGIVMDGVKVKDSINETFSLYLPTNFDTDKKWPVLFVFDMEGKSSQALRMFVTSAEQRGYILVASSNVHDSLSTASNILITSRMLKTVSAVLPLRPGRVYMSGFAAGGRFSSIVPNFIRGINGVLACGASIPNLEILSKKNQFHYIGIVGEEDYNFPQMKTVRSGLNKMGFPNRLIVFDGAQEWPSPKYITDALQTFDLAAMAKGSIAKNDVLIAGSYNMHLNRFNTLLARSRPLRANNLLDEMMKMYRPHMDIDSLKERKKNLKKEKNYKARHRARNATFFKENLIKEDFVYYLEEDLSYYNYNNLGWWTYQMEELKKYSNSSNVFQKRMGIRLNGYVNDLVKDYMDIYNAKRPKDEEGLNLLWMLKTITAPQEYPNYLNIISNSARIEDYGTTLFYVEELLKNGYTDKEELYGLEHTALIRITPEFNKIVAKYLKDARYGPIGE